MEKYIENGDFISVLEMCVAHELLVTSNFM